MTTDYVVNKRIEASFADVIYGLPAVTEMQWKCESEEEARFRLVTEIMNSQAKGEIKKPEKPLEAITDYYFARMIGGGEVFFTLLRPYDECVDGDRDLDDDLPF